MKIDSHQHFWRYNEREFGWINQEMQQIRRDFLPEDLLKELDGVGFDGSIAVQARQNLDETAWLLELASKYSFIKGVVGWVDLCSSDARNQLEQFSSDSKLKGVRHVIHDEPDIDFMLRPAFLNGIRLLVSLNLTYDILIFPKHLCNAMEFVKQFPDQVFVLDHIAKPDIRNGIVYPWKAGIGDLAKFPNVYCKLSGMVTEASWTSWKPADFKPYLETVFESFGTDRVMIGSDWPVCQVAGNYKEVMGIVEEFINELSDSEKQKVMGQNARKAYHLD